MSEQQRENSAQQPHCFKINNKTTPLNFYLLPKNTTRTPLPTEELELLQAGMGRQTVSIPEDSDHTEISRILTETFPKMDGLRGGWLLHKATGGSGRRKLVVIPPEAEGYSAKALRAVSAGGKATFYIVPLQETLDTSPLPPDSHHFSKMPKKTCYQCDEVMPLQMLAVHIKTCKGKLSSDETDNDNEVQTSKDFWIVEDKSKQLRKSMELYGLVDQTAANSEACHSLFVPGKIIKRVIIPSASESIKVCSEARKKDVVHTKDVKDVCDV
uniref:uncharacterized protein n=1 Tax=Centroberyx gerrardi TaxID=166262 RepID=UPI003AAE6967